MGNYSLTLPCPFQNFMKICVPTEDTHIELFLNCQGKLKLPLNVHNNVQESYFDYFATEEGEI